LGENFPLEAKLVGTLVHGNDNGKTKELTLATVVRDIVKAINEAGLWYVVGHP